MCRIVLLAFLMFFSCAAGAAKNSWAQYAPAGTWFLINPQAPQIIYPPKAIRKKLEGEVVYRYQILPNGTVGRVIIVKSTNRIFDKPTIDALKKQQWEWRGKGKPHAKWLAPQTIEFHLDGDEEKSAPPRNPHSQHIIVVPE